MAFKLDKNTFKWIMIAMVAVIVVMVGLLVFHAAGGFSFLQPEPTPTPPPGGTTEEETGPWGDKSYTWEYNGVSHTLNLYISKEIYQRYQHGISGTLLPENLTDYIITAGDGGVVADTAGQIKRIITQQGYTDDADIAGLALAFSQSIPYQTDAETGHSSAYPRTPAVLLAEQIGDSTDHAVLAAAILKELGYGCALLYYPPTYDRLTIIPDATALGLISDDDSDRPVYTAALANTSTTLPVAPFWVVDTNTKGVPVAAYNGITPEIFTEESFWTGKHYTPTDGKYPALSLTDTLLLKESNNLTFSPRDWQQEVADYYADSWYPSGIGWSMQDKWQLYQQFVTFEDVPATLYTPWGTAVHNATVPWRIVYQITGMDDDAQKDMTPYSDVRIALYSYNEQTGTADLIKVFGWQGLYGADKYQTVGPFSPGSYAIAVFVRNAGVDITLQYHGKDGTSAYTGGI
ncbi:MAG: hypothetical protein O0X49_05845 [Methanocorpusculum sp.]|nr:hypothetical protein [Methanocorpusculum sp.]